MTFPDNNAARAGGPEPLGPGDPLGTLVLLAEADRLVREDEAARPRLPPAVADRAGFVRGLLEKVGPPWSPAPATVSDGGPNNVPEIDSAISGFGTETVPAGRSVSLHARPVDEHRRECLCALSASALVNAPDDQATDLTELVRERVFAAFRLQVEAAGHSPAVAPRRLVEWVQSELFFDLEFTPNEERVFLRTAAEVLAAAERDGDLVATADWKLVRLPAATPVADPTADTVYGGGSTALPPGLPLLADRVALLRDLDDERVADWYLIKVGCGLSIAEVAARCAWPADEVGELLNKAEQFLVGRTGHRGHLLPFAQSQPLAYA